MKALRDYKLALEKTAQRGDGIAWAAPFDPPIHGTVNGLPVRILQAGDLPGASTVFNCVDAHGFSTAVKQADVLIIDGAYQPLREPPTR